MIGASNGTPSGVQVGPYEVVATIGAVGPPSLGLSPARASVGEARRSPGADLVVIAESIGHYQVLPEVAEAALAKCTARAIHDSGAMSP
jgi:hypothetical protein